VTVTTIIMLQNIAVLIILSIYLRILKNKYYGLTKKLSSATNFNIDNNQKCFLRRKSAY